jgi:hypothetical protein
LPKPQVALSVMFRPLLAIVARPVDLDNKARGGTIEIGDIWADRVLATKLQALGPAAKDVP